MMRIFVSGGLSIPKIPYIRNSTGLYRSVIKNYFKWCVTTIDSGCIIKIGYYTGSDLDVLLFTEAFCTPLVAGDFQRYGIVPRAFIRMHWVRCCRNIPIAKTPLPAGDGTACN